jgi:hypothetical protein
VLLFFFKKKERKKRKWLCITFFILTTPSTLAKMVCGGYQCGKSSTGHSWCLVYKRHFILILKTELVFAGQVANKLD